MAESSAAVGQRDRQDCECCRCCRLEHQRPAPVREPVDHPEAEHDGHADHAEDSRHGEHTGHADHSGHEQMFRQRFWVSLALSVPVLYWSELIQSALGYTAPVFTGSALIVPVVSTVIFGYGGLPFLSMARWELAARAPAMMTLISLAITVAYGFSMATLVWDLGEGFFWELVTLVDIMLLGHWVGDAQRPAGVGGAGCAGQADAGHRRGRPARRPGRGALRRASCGWATPSWSARVRPSRPTGWSSRVRREINEAMITGESRPLDKGPGTQLIAGTVNEGNGSLRVEVGATGEDTALAGIMRLVAEAQSSRSSTQLLADRAAALLFWAALASAAVTLLVWSIIEGGVDQPTIARVVTVLVIACPHALGLAIPLVVANTTQLAAANGVLIRDREAIDTARLLEVIAVDKTGTLTEGSIGVAGIATIDGVVEDDALATAAAVEGDSEHLMARAIRQAADQRGLDLPQVEDFEILKGRGVAAVVDGKQVHIGGPRMLEHLQATPAQALSDFAGDAGRRGSSVVYLVREGEPVAAFALADVIRPESYTAVRALHERGVAVAMLTGDSEDVAKAVAGELGIDTYRAQVLPADKDDYVAELQRGGRRVAMVGDGVNDAPALARADIGIAIGGGTDVAVESAGLILVKSNPLDIVRILILSAAAYRKQLQNIWWGAGYNIIAIPLAAGVLAPIGFIMPPAVGALLMSVSTIVVAINAQLLRRVDLSVE